MINRLLSRRLSGKLLMMTIGFVMLAELVIFIPSAALYRQDWLTERADQAALLAQALAGTPDYNVTEMLAKQFMDDTDVMMVSAKKINADRSELLLGEPPVSETWEVIMLEDVITRRPLFRDAFRSFFGSPEGYLRVIAPSPVKGQDQIGLIIPKAKLRDDMREYFRRIVLLSLAIAIITGSLIYLAMLIMIIRPIENLAGALARFRDDPHKPSVNLPPGDRQDEIGQLEREFYDMKQSIRASLKQRERLATLGMAVAKINHDLRNVLTSAQLVSDRLAMDQEERVANMGQRLTRAIDRGVKLTAEVLNFSQSKEDPPELQNIRLCFLLGEVAGDVLANFGSGPRKISFINNVPSELTAYVDPDHTYRIFHNLFRNAAQAMAAIKDDEAKRQLSVAIEPAAQEAEQADAAAKPLLNILIADTADGIPDRAQKNLFKAFAGSTGRGNTGLGLTISKELAMAQGGDITLKKTDGTGTVFSVSVRASA